MTQSRNGTSDHSAVYRWLKDMLIEFRFRPGEPIMINDIGDRLRVSATPVRESLIRLRSEGFLETTHRRGFFAKVLHPKEMIELHELMSLILIRSIERFLEVDAGTPGATLLHDLHDDNAVGRARRLIRRLDTIYESLAALARNDAMLDVFRNACERTRYVRTIDLEAPAQVPVALRLIDGLSSALRSRDASTAAATIRRDIDGKIARMPMLVKDGISRSYAVVPPDETRVPQCLHSG